jgi:O-antigen ligase
MSKLYDNIIFYGLIFLVVFTPLAFGTTQPWSIYVFKLTTVLLLIAWLLKIPAENQLVIHKTVLYIPLLLFIVYELFQIIPLPASIVNSFSPASYKLQSSASALLNNVATKYALSLNIHQSSFELLKTVCYFIIFFLVINQIRSVKQLNILISIILVTGFVISMFALIQKFTWTGKIFWLQETPALSGPFGPFVNYDHYGGFMNLIIPLGFAYILSPIQLDKKILVGFMTTIISVSLMLCRSRGAVLSFVASLVFLILFILLARRHFDKKLVIKVLSALILIIVFVLLFIYWIDWGLFVGRMKTIGLEQNFFHERLQIWYDSFKIVKDFTIFGIGFGNYGNVFPIYQRHFTDFFWRYTHNDYLQFLIETGLVGCAIVVTFITIFFYQTVRKIRNTHNRQLIGLIIGTLVSIITMLLHSTVDFNLHTTSNAFLFTVLVGLCYVIVSRRGELARPENNAVIPATQNKNVSSPHADDISRGGDLTNAYIIQLSKKSSYIITILGVLCLLFVFIIPFTRQYLAHYTYTQSERVGAGLPARGDSLTTAVSLDPSNSLYHHRLGLHYESLAADKTLPQAERKSLLNKAEQELSKAIRLAPTVPDYWISYGWLYGNLGLKGQGTKFYQKAIELSPFRPQVQDQFIKYLITF